MLKRFFRILMAQALASLPDVINYVAGTALPALPPPWNVLLGAGLNAIGKYARNRNEKWSWSPV